MQSTASASGEKALERSRVRRKKKTVEKRRRPASKNPAQPPNGLTASTGGIASAIVESVVGSGTRSKGKVPRLTAYRLFALLAPFVGAAFLEVLDKSDIADQAKKKLKKWYHKLPMT